MKVSELIGDYGDPLGNGGSSIPDERADEVATEIREMLDAIYKFNCVVDREEFVAAWPRLNSRERAAYKHCVAAGTRDVDT
jgi:hypothetical protein